MCIRDRGIEMISIKSPREIEAMRRAGRITAQARALAGSMVAPGAVSYTHLDLNGLQAVLHGGLGGRLSGGLSSKRSALAGTAEAQDVYKRQAGWRPFPPC